MRTACTLLSGLWVCALLVCGATSATFAEETPGNLADSWTFRIKAGHEQQFDEAFLKHLEVRKGSGDPREWHAWEPITGDDLNRLIVRSCCFEWKDLDAYREWGKTAGVLADWNQNVHPHIEEYEHYFGAVDLENSNWSRTDAPDYVGVTAMHPELTSGRSVAEHISALSTAAKEMGWPYEWAWVRTIGGDGGVTLVIPYDNFAAMAPPEKTFIQALSEKMGSVAAGKLMDSWLANFEKTRYTIYRHRADLSMTSAE